MKRKRVDLVDERRVRGLVVGLLVLLGLAVFWSWSQKLIEKSQSETEVADTVSEVEWKNEKLGENEKDGEKNGFEVVVESISSKAGLQTQPVVELQIPEKAELSGGVQVFQSFNNCGPAALSMAFSHLGIDENQEELGERLRPYRNSSGDNDDKSVTMKELAVVAQDFGLVSFHRPAGSVELVEALIAQDVPVITRTLLQADDDIGHYRVVTGYDRTSQELIQNDSLQGKGLRFGYEEFERLWKPYNFEFLVIAKSDQRIGVESVLGELVDENLAWQRAQEMAQEDLDENAADVWAGLNLSVASFYLGDYQKSVDAYEKVEVLLPWRTLWYQVEPILAYLALGDEERVLEMSEKVLNNYNRAYSELYYLRGMVFEKQGDATRAEAEFEKANQYNQSGSYKVNVVI